MLIDGVGTEGASDAARFSKRPDANRHEAEADRNDKRDDFRPEPVSARVPFVVGVYRSFRGKPRVIGLDIADCQQNAAEVLDIHLASPGLERFKVRSIVGGRVVAGL
jgi:hypothetical protein